MSRDSSMRDRKDGLREGIARGLSQACVYCYEAQKTIIQVHGKLPKLPPVQFVQHMSRGLIESVITSGIVFGSYFSVYNQIGMANPMAGPLATIATSFIKIPISNSMRVLQAGLAPSFTSAMTKIVKAQNVKGLYSGYRTSVLEDMIEFDMRVRSYRMIREVLQTYMHVSPAIALGVGAVSGMMAAWITTPFDTIRAHLAVEATKNGNKHSPMRITQNLIKRGGVQRLYSGATVRAVASGLKSALFYMIFESMPSL